VGIHLGRYLRQRSLAISGDYPLQHPSISVLQLRISPTVVFRRRHLAQVYVDCHNPWHSSPWNIHKFGWSGQGAPAKRASIIMPLRERNERILKVLYALINQLVRLLQYYFILTYITLYTIGCTPNQEEIGSFRDLFEQAIRLAFVSNSSASPEASFGGFPLGDAAPSNKQNFRFTSFHFARNRIISYCQMLDWYLLFRCH